MTNCPNCSHQVSDLVRLLDGSSEESRVAAGVDTEASCWTFGVSCGGRRSVVELSCSIGGGRGPAGSWSGRED